MVLLDRYIDYGMDHHNIRLRKPGSQQDISQVLNYNAQEGDIDCCFKGEECLYVIQIRLFVNPIPVVLCGPRKIHRTF